MLDTPMRYFIPITLLLAAACGDLKFDENLLTSPGGSPPGSTTSLGSMSAIVDNDQFNAPLQTPAIWRNDSFGFTAINATGVTKVFGLSLRLPGPGTYNVGGTREAGFTSSKFITNGSFNVAVMR